MKTALPPDRAVPDVAPLSLRPFGGWEGDGLASTPRAWEFMPAAGELKLLAPALRPGETYARFLGWLREHQDEIIEQWVDRLTVMSPSYRRRPTAELFQTVTEAFKANQVALENGDLERMDRFIDFITEKRLHAGFPLSDVQKAFELFRELVVARLCQGELTGLLPECLPRINACLAYTIHCFSDCFQGMHERYLRQHAHQLERQVHSRTAELAESERRYKTLVNEINDGYFIIQGERIVFANQAFCQMHGASLEGVAGRRFLDFVAPEDRALVMGAVWESLALRSAGGSWSTTGPAARPTRRPRRSSTGWWTWARGRCASGCAGTSASGWPWRPPSASTSAWPTWATWPPPCPTRSVTPCPPAPSTCSSSSRSWTWTASTAAAWRSRCAS